MSMYAWEQNDGVMINYFHLFDNVFYYWEKFSKLSVLVLNLDEKLIRPNFLFICKTSENV